RLQIYALKSSEGFTYIEMLLSLFVLSMILFITIPTIRLFGSIELNEQSFDIDVFIEDVFEVETNKKNIVITKNSLTFDNEHGTITYRLSNNRIVKSIDKKGFIPLMTNVLEFNVTEDKHQVYIMIEEGDETYEMYIKK
ncbi:competence type IV pilus minor pilin ComGF, partial [Nosocomiicoccus massiliensis]|uniref:competence type IV pilus minor pilin ComGF n=1 Tax=Nosocomiicoccus massiliensis TaxID=1232430 RepID=UPI000594617D